MSAKKKDVVVRANATKDYRAKFIRSDEIAGDEAFLRASLCISVHVRICGSSYTATNQSTVTTVTFSQRRKCIIMHIAKRARDFNRQARIYGGSRSHSVALN